uniref:DUF569 domain-containing protein n=1 Tax=Oryza meridionalis TaxID=40149 RepID=A0A0E0EID3_9ORYZ
MHHRLASLAVSPSSPRHATPRRTTPRHAEKPRSSKPLAAARASPAHHPRRAAMQVFHVVRLRNLWEETYITADEDGRSAYHYDPGRRPSHEAIWAVQLAVAGEPPTQYVLLRGAYGRYLGAPDAVERHWPLSCCWPAPVVGQRDFDQPVVDAIMWRAVRRTGHVVCLHDKSGRYLRGKLMSTLVCGGRPSLTVGDGRLSDDEKELRWEVRPVLPSPGRPELPIATEADLAELFVKICFPPRRREIQFVAPDGDGNIVWDSFQYQGRSVQLLRNELENRVGYAITVCVRAGSPRCSSTCLAAGRPCTSSLSGATAKEKEEKAAAAEGADLLCSLLEQGRLASPAWPPAAQPSDHPMIDRDRWNPTGAPAGMRALVWFANTVALVLLAFFVVPLVPRCNSIEEEATAVADWTALLEDVVITVMGYLADPDDLVRSGAPPWLLYSCDAYGPTAAALYCPATGKSLRIPLPAALLDGRPVIGASQGWLVTVDEAPNLHLVLVNPITGATAALPPITSHHNVERFTSRKGEGMGVVLSRSPVEGSACVALLLHRPDGDVSFARVGDERWTPVAYPGQAWSTGCRHAIYNDADGLFYTLRYDGSVYAIDVPRAAAASSPPATREVMRRGHAERSSSSATACFPAEHFPALKPGCAYLADDHELVSVRKHCRRDIGRWDMKRGQMERLSGEDDVAAPSQPWLNWPTPSLSNVLARQPMMEVFQEVEFAALRIWKSGSYLHADEDGRSVYVGSLPRDGGGDSRHCAVWAVEPPIDAAAPLPHR